MGFPKELTEKNIWVTGGLPQIRMAAKTEKYRLPLQQAKQPSPTIQLLGVVTSRL